jgi:hypothetical protein
MAFCYITIPSLENPLNKLQLYILSAQTAYLNQSLSQGLKRKKIYSNQRANRTELFRFKFGSVELSKSRFGFGSVRLIFQNAGSSSDRFGSVRLEPNSFSSVRLIFAL